MLSFWLGPVGLCDFQSRHWFSSWFQPFGSFIKVGKSEHAFSFTSTFTYWPVSPHRTWERPHTNFSHSPKFQPLKWRFSLWNLSPKKTKIWHCCRSTQQPHCVFVPSFCPRHFVQMASDKPINYHSGLWLLWSCIIMGQTSSKLQKWKQWR